MLTGKILIFSQIKHADWVPGHIVNQWIRWLVTGGHKDEVAGAAYSLFLYSPWFCWHMSSVSLQWHIVFLYLGYSVKPTLCWIGPLLLLLKPNYHSLSFSYLHLMQQKTCKAFKTELLTHKQILVAFPIANNYFSVDFHSAETEQHHRVGPYLQQSCWSSCLHFSLSSIPEEWIKALYRCTQ